MCWKPSYESTLPIWESVLIFVSPLSTFIQIFNLISKAIHLNCPWYALIHNSLVHSQTSIYLFSKSSELLNWGQFFPQICLHTSLNWEGQFYFTTIQQNFINIVCISRTESLISGVIKDCLYSGGGQWFTLIIPWFCQEQHFSLCA